MKLEVKNDILTGKLTGNALHIELIKKDKEIERLNKDLDTSIEICNNKQKEIVRLNNIINELRRIMFSNKMLCEQLYEKSNLSGEDFEQKHPYTIGMYDVSANLLRRLEEMEEDK